VALHVLYVQEEQGFSKGGGQVLPWNTVEDFRTELTSKQGAAEGLLIINGAQNDFNRAAATIAKSSPVISFKTCGGASEQLSMMIDRRHLNDLNDKEGAKKGDDKSSSSRLCSASAKMGGDVENPPVDNLDTVQDESKGESADDFPVRGNPHPKGVLEGGDFASKVLFDGSIERAVPEELIVIDLHPRNKKAGVNCQMQMAQMLTMVGGDEERQLGFKPAERQSMAKAWDHSIRFEANAKKERLESDIFSYLMLLIGLLLVCAVVAKQAAFPPKPKVDACGHVIAAAKHIQHKTPKEWLPILKNVLLIMPILNGLLLSVNTKFNPCTYPTLIYMRVCVCC